MDFYLIRHGEPDYERDTITEYGRRQAEALAEHLAALGIDEIYASPLGRAQATAAPLAERLGKSIQTTPWAAEIPFSVFTPTYILRGKECMEAGYEWYKTESFSDLPIAEMTAEIFAGLDGLLAKQGYTRERRLYKVDAPNEKKIVLFTHGFVGATLLAHLFEIPINLAWANTKLSTTGITQFRFQNYDAGYTSPRCLALNVRPHLWNVAK